jgi:O-antigen/teichoic acid export membrane protein
MFWRGVFGYLPVQVVQGLVGFGALVVFTRLLTPEQYGQYALALTVAAIVHTLSTSWTEAAMERFYQTSVEQKDEPAHFATLHAAYAALALGAVLLSALVLVFAPFDRPLRLALGAGILSVLLKSGFTLIQHRRKGGGRVVAYAAGDMFITAGGFAFGGLFALAGWGAASPFIGAAAAALVCLLFSGREELKRAQGARFDPGRARRYLQYGFPVSLSLLLSLVVSGTDRVLLAVFLDEATVGAYHAGYSLTSRTLDIIFIWIGLAGGPALIGALEQGGQPALQKAARLQADVLILITLPAAVGLALVAQPLAEILIGADLREGAVRAAPWIAASAFFGGMTAYYLDYAFTLSRRSDLLLLVMALPAGLNVVLNLLLIPPFGFDGALWGTTISVIVGAVASYLLGRRAQPLPLPWGTLLRTGVGCLLMAVALYLMPRSGGLVELGSKVCAGAVVFALVAILLDTAGLRTLGVARVLRSRLASSTTPETL